MKTVFLIGGTGFIGKQLVEELAKENVNILLLVRSKIKATRIFQERGILKESVMHFVEGDLTKVDLGLSAEDQERVLKTDVIIHAGGPMDIQATSKEAASIFLNGAKHISELAKSIHQSKGLQQFIHVVGYMSPFDDQNSKIAIDVFEEGNDYLKIKNPYERTKFLADLYIRQQASAVGYPLSVINPPTVVGSSQTGSTEQIAGLGLLVKSMRRGLMPVIPGGKDYRLPLISNDEFAKFIVQVFKLEQPAIQTYTLVEDKEHDQNVAGLLSMMSESMNMKAPSISVPMPLMKAIMKSGVSKLTNIPSDGLNFMTKRTFSNASVKKIMGEDWFKKTSVMTFFPAVVADLDYRMMDQNGEHQHLFKRTLCDNNTLYQLQGAGKPFILLHGLLSDGEDLFPLAQELHEKTGQPVWILDLPGLGRSPFKREKHLLDIYLNVVKKVIEKATNGAHLIGHSFGAYILLEALGQGYIDKKYSITLLQPPVAKQKANSLYVPQFLNKWTLRLATTHLIERYVLRNGLFESTESIPKHYIEKIRNSFTSPRILNTTVQLNHLLLKTDQGDFKEVTKDNIHMIWGEYDRGYSAPSHLGKVDFVPYGHHFPLSHPSETAALVINNICTSR
ncbi:MULTISPECIES: alpha/beta fold hydrolase [Bacillus]|uniref:Nucleoside-diphosphate-sugar epimerase/pimeloyl-ACP methyl ester carboxylesterase n=1 Tax=Bacillus aerius TaxID=293388 RepID=A0ABR6AZ14_9BACI|nr:MULTISPECIES: alpha/beta fold hydrolase [Bacillus]MBA8917095.1 nucleoside-diphosphate-sugar epimerase/pimeloyl-ACP methyl ester carboxylesterase [Bacillus aerius]MEC1182825.1 alpha/beta fold hydrolase [Bacillus altitudinis]WHX70926.1 alpha/beta fold hydrolase [Bacillus altitudinis]BDC59959.1 MxaA domain-containing protein [Bacillus altitudinis]